jgi:hypothetical protein
MFSVFDKVIFYTLIACFLVFIILCIVSAKDERRREKEAKAQEAQRKAQEAQREVQEKIERKDIMERGGPKTLKEYLLFFPNACHCCGSRDWIEASDIYKPSDEGGLGESTRYYPPEPRYLKKCKRCGNLMGDPNVNPLNLSYSESELRVSPIDPIGNSIPDFPYQKNE